MPPKAENKYQSFEIDHKIPCDKIIASIAACSSITCVIAYFVYLGWYR